MQNNYQAYAKVYDAFKGDRTGNIQLLENLIRKYHPRANTLLDLACGTGGIAEGLAGSFTIIGLDNATHMLRVAQKKLPHTRLLRANMVDFKIDQMFDVVYCVHNSVNHLLTFREWEDMFSNVAVHLNEDGIFIFDINPVEKMDELAKLGPGTIQAEKNYIIAQVTKDTQRPELYHWDVKIFLRRRRNKFLLHHEAIKVSTYPLDQVTQALVKSFDIADFFILENAEKFDDIGRAYYICTKR